MFYSVASDQSWRMLHVYLWRMCILLLGRLFYRCLLDIVGLWCYSSPLLSRWSLFSLEVPSIIKVGQWSLQLLLLNPLFLFNSVSFCFVYLGALFLGIYVFLIVKSSWWIDSVAILKSVSLTVVTFFVLNLFGLILQQFDVDSYLLLTHRKSWSNCIYWDIVNMGLPND